MTLGKTGYILISLIISCLAHNIFNVAIASDNTALPSPQSANAIIYNVDYQRNTFVPLIDLYTRFNPENIEGMIAEIKKQGIDHMQLSRTGIETLSRKLVALCSPEQFKELIALNVVTPENPETYAHSLVVESANEDWIIRKFEILKQHGISARHLFGKMMIHDEAVYTAPMDYAARFGYTKVLQYLAEQSAQIQSLEMAWVMLLIKKPKGYVETVKELLELGYKPTPIKSSLQKIVNDDFVQEETELTALLKPFL